MYHTSGNPPIISVGGVQAGPNLIDSGDKGTLRLNANPGDLTTTNNLVVQSDVSSISEVYAPFSPADVCLMVFAGQSNSQGWNQTLPVEEQITTPLVNVFVAGAVNKTYASTEITWAGYTSADAYIVGVAGARCTTAHYIAKAWQARITAGETLPDLYIIHVSVAGAGIHTSLTTLNGQDQWSPERSDANTSSCYHMARHSIALAIKGFMVAGKNPRKILEKSSSWGLTGTNGNRKQHSRTLLRAIRRDHSER
jgi:hypothetical protein